jgi:hypothetical protein
LLGLSSCLLSLGLHVPALRRYFSVLGSASFCLRHRYSCVSGWHGASLGPHSAWPALWLVIHSASVILFSLRVHVLSFYVRCGSTLSWVSTGLGFSASAFGTFSGGSSLSIRSSSALADVLSVASFTRHGSFVSMAGSGQVGTLFLTFDLMTLGSSLSVSSFTRVGDSVSITDSMIHFADSMIHFDSSLSIPRFARMGSSVSMLFLA